MYHYAKEKKRVEAEMRAGMEELDEDKLRNALQEAQQAGADPYKIRQAQDRLDKIVNEKRAIEDIGAYQRQNLEEAPMQNIIDRAEQISYVTEDIKYLKHMLYDLSPEKFAQEQLKAAVRSKDQDRAIRITIKIKDMFFKQQGDMFTFRGFPKFRTPVEWSNLKFTLFSSTREELQRTMFRWTKTPIHASLIELPGKSGKDGTRMFRNLLGYMGDRSYNFPEHLLIEMVTEALDKVPLRDEIYAQMIKQLTQNPDSQSAFKGWSAMAVCLEAFPPNPEFENYFEVWLRKTIKDASKRTRYLTLLHQAIFCGARTTPPTENEMKRIMGGETLRRKAGFQQEEKAAPQYQGLQVEVADEQIEWNEVEDISDRPDAKAYDTNRNNYNARKPMAPKPMAPKPMAPKPMAPKPSVPRFGGPKPMAKKPTLPKFGGGGPKKPTVPKFGGVAKKFGTTSHKPALPTGARPQGGIIQRNKPGKLNFNNRMERKQPAPRSPNGPVIPRIAHGNIGSVAAKRAALKKAPVFKFGGPPTSSNTTKPAAPPAPIPKPAAPKPPPPKPVSLWRATVDQASGDTYYWNIETQEVTWDKPADFVG